MDGTAPPIGTGRHQPVRFAGKGKRQEGENGSNFGHTEKSAMCIELKDRGEKTK